MPEIETTLGKLRRKRGISVIHLANATGREPPDDLCDGGRHLRAEYRRRAAPGAGRSKRRWRSCSRLPKTFPSRTCARRRASFCPVPKLPQAGQAVQLCRVDKRLMAARAFAGAVVSSRHRCGRRREAGCRRARRRCRSSRPKGDFTNRILVAGCDPGISVLSRHVQAAGVELVLAHRNSSQALSLLKEGCVHVAGTHLRDESSGESNLPAIDRLFAKNSVAVISFAVWEEGILTGARQSEEHPRH